MWGVRKKAIDALNNALQEEARLIYEGFELTNEIIQLLYDASEPKSFLTVCGLVLLKGRNLGQGIFSLALDGLAQEAGALLRPTIECIELLEYFRKDPKRIEEVIEDKLPSAGDIGKKIDGRFKGLRDYLNRNASHFKLTPGAMLHLIDWRNTNVKLKQLYTEKVLGTNLRDLFLILLLLVSAAAECLDTCGRLPHSILRRLDLWRRKGLRAVAPEPRNFD